MLTHGAYTNGFHPIRLWMYCEGCHHIYSSCYPKDLNRTLESTSREVHIKPKTQLLSSYGKVISKLKEFSRGNRLLEVGVGAGEMIAVAQELQLDVMGIDIRPAYANAVSRMLNVPIKTIDYQEFEVNQAFDLVCMGDVIEHLEDPRQALIKANELLNKGGVLWISTPNFESAFSKMLKTRDPMWRVAEHLNYFSYHSLKVLLEEVGFKVADYQISSHYNGSMEVTAIKE
ncbi:class I SAM-dependent methyltransferase [Halobacillus salinus]|uniref:class I SAM-dependent methyltransferase n=1 Tax=Halobacillus salinus TaxID=192814 RepID=UPI0009A8E0AC|nr:class I SAM-dependent methyltransferase [Halobacillus salinus]